MTEKERVFVLKNKAVLEFTKRSIEAATNRGELWEVVLRPFKLKRSKAQNRLLWKWYREISKQKKSEFGDYRNEDYWHARLRLDFGMIEETISHKGFDVPLLTSTKSLKVDKFSEYLKNIEVWAMTRGLFLTFPDYYNIAIGPNSEATSSCSDKHFDRCLSNRAEGANK